jgi:hypothetical protein
LPLLLNVEYGRDLGSELILEWQVLFCALDEYIIHPGVLTLQII